MTWLLIAGFAISSSIDNFGVGLSYGVQRVRIPALSNLLIAVICFVFSLLGIVSGVWLAELLPGILPDLIAFAVLSVIGLRIMVIALSQQKKRNNGVLNEPEKMDFDGSSHISLGEALLLGVALSANALTNGIGAGLLELSALAIALSAAAGSYLTLWIGVALGVKLSGLRIGRMTVGQFGTFMSGVIILLIACTRLF
ncbi:MULTISPECIES: sporulation membrane protein YtaF [Sporosarcina]|uniref:sporulation membrane protein YtaF n=1 Tax=Sporosarcina TaxID=1569 RepID=UPI00129BD645|nr:MULTISPECIES: sporulation membrane protein YtaF [Sporosarcina]GKV66683.1 sporulation membrane protein YtaF [Sporosarcina sp. NCCP-2331]GLB57010.1 sporulation membrane protein YtaF [Sporosarcina sp. NCCP-2378]